uniref:Sulfate transport system permease protein CysT n=1 Tax=Avrainvillea sp. HV04061 TaxID=2364086 RepID=A0A3B8DHN7_9CHLO|nr:Sulfate ABC transporter permease subunit CysT [Avrainvillea sp. HV04061]
MKLFIYIYFCIFLFLPVYILLYNVGQNSFDYFLERAFEPVAICTYQTSLLLALIACCLNTIFGFLIAWVLVRVRHVLRKARTVLRGEKMETFDLPDYNFTGKKILDIVIDLPFALPTSVAGFTLCIIYGSQGWIGFFLSKLGIQIVFTKLGILLAMIFVSFPFLIRIIQPILFDIDPAIEEAAWSLGASPWETFLKFIWPILNPAVFTGMALSFARSIGEYGSIVIISSNFPFKDLITPVFIFQCLEQYDYKGATIIGSCILFFSLLFLGFINILNNLMKNK